MVGNDGREWEGSTMVQGPSVEYGWTVVDGECRRSAGKEGEVE